MRRVNFNETYYIIDEVVRLASESEVVSSDDKFEVFDVGAGTGIVGQKLVDEHSFKPIVGCDASSRFVDHLLTTGAYKEASEIWMG